MPEVKLACGQVVSVEEGASWADVAAAAGIEAVAALVDGELRDIRDPIQEGRTVKLLKLTDPESLDVLRHTAAHILAQAVRRLFPGVKLAIGPAISDGFY